MAARMHRSRCYLPGRVQEPAWVNERAVGGTQASGLTEIQWCGRDTSPKPKGQGPQAPYSTLYCPGDMSGH